MRLYWSQLVYFGRALLAWTTWILPLKSWSSIGVLSSPIVANPVSSSSAYVRGHRSSSLSLSLLMLSQHKLRCLLLLVSNTTYSDKEDWISTDYFRSSFLGDL